MCSSFSFSLLIILLLVSLPSFLYSLPLPPRSLIPQSSSSSSSPSPPSSSSSSSSSSPSTRIISPVVYGSTTCISSASRPIIVTAESACPCFLRYIISSALPTTWDVFLLPAASYDAWASADFAGDPDGVVDSLSTRRTQTIGTTSILATPDTDVYLSGRFRLAVRTNTPEARCFVDGSSGTATSVVLQSMPPPCPFPSAGADSANGSDSDNSRSSSADEDKVTRVGTRRIYKNTNTTKTTDAQTRRWRWQLQNINIQQGSITRIAGGTPTSRHDSAPYVVQIVRVSSSRSFDHSHTHSSRSRQLLQHQRQESTGSSEPKSCAGVFVSREAYVVTAAHCGVQNATDAFRVRVTLPNKVVDYRISRAWAHEQFSTIGWGGTGGATRLGYLYDVAVLEVQGLPRRKFSSLGLETVGLHYVGGDEDDGSENEVENANNQLPQGTIVTTLGYGAIEAGWRGGNSSTLRRVALQLSSDAACATSSPAVNASLHVCAAPTQGTSGCGSCEGDGGGPLLHNGSILVGITSFAVTCGNPGPPSVYTRVSTVAEWTDVTIVAGLATRRAPFWDRRWAVAMTFVCVAVLAAVITVAAVVAYRRGMCGCGGKLDSDALRRQPYSGSEMPSETGISE